jgi:hypothetical protein
MVRARGRDSLSASRSSPFCPSDQCSLFWGEIQFVVTFEHVTNLLAHMTTLL